MAFGSNRGRRIRIGWLQSKGNAGGGGTLPPATNPAVARLRAHRSSPRAVLRGSFRPVLGSGVSSALRVMHLGQKQGTAGLCSPGMAAAAALRGQAPRREAVRGLQGPWLPRLAQKERGAVQVITVELKGMCCRVGRPAARSGGGPRRRSRAGRCGAPPSFGIPRFDLWDSCKAGSGVNAGQTAPVARNRDSGPNAPGKRPGEIPAR